MTCADALSYRADTPLTDGIGCVTAVGRIDGGDSERYVNIVSKFGSETVTNGHSYWSTAWCLLNDYGL